MGLAVTTKGGASLGLDRATLERVRGTGTVKTYPDGAEVVREGDTDSRAYIVDAGAVDVVRGDGPVRRVHAGEMVGELAFLDPRPRAVSVRAVGPVTVCVLDQRDVVKALADDPKAMLAWMSVLSDRMHSRLGSRGESAEADATLAALTQESLAHRAVKHRYLAALARNDVPDLRWAMADFGRQYYGYSVHFPRYLTTVISRLEHADHRAALLENLTEESGNYGEEELESLAQIGVDRSWIVGIPHPRLFQRFRAALGVVQSRAEDDALEVVCWREMFLGVLAGGSPAEAVGALGLGTEGIVSSVYRPFVEALKALPDLAPRDTVFFPLHTEVDDHHQATLLDIARHYAQTEQGRRDIAKGMRKALYLRASFWDWLYERALTRGEGPSSRRVCLA